MIVMKFGGTSVEDASAIECLRAIVQERRREQPVVVVSAMARVTDGLLKAASLAMAGDEAGTLKVFSDLQARHEVTAIELLEYSGRVIPKIEKLFEELRSVLQAVCALQELTPRTSDRIVSFGERLSTVIVTAVLEEGGVPSELVDARECIFTDDNYWAAAPRADETNDRLRDRLLPLLGQGVVPVLGGFIASNGKGQTTTLGRGGSDFSAAIIGAAFGAERVDIWTDVDGIRYYRSATLSADAAHQDSELSRGGGVGALRGQGFAPGDAPACHREEHSSVRAEFAQSPPPRNAGTGGKRRNAERQGHRGKEGNHPAGSQRAAVIAAQQPGARCLPF